MQYWCCALRATCGAVIRADPVVGREGNSPDGLSPQGWDGQAGVLFSEGDQYWNGWLLSAHFNSFIVDVFWFLPLTQGKREDLNCFQQSWSYFSDKGLFWFSAHTFCKTALILPDLFPDWSTSFFCLADFTTWTYFDVHYALLCNGHRSPHLPLFGYVSFIYLGPVYS